MSKPEPLASLIRKIKTSLCIVCHRHGLIYIPPQSVHCTRCESTYNVAQLGIIVKE